jgi:hypothetical protein
MIRLYLLFAVIAFLISGFNVQNAIDKDVDLVKSNTWFIAGPSKESQEIINSIRLKKGIIKITAKDSPVGEIELNVTITPSETNDAVPKSLSDNSGFVTITYRATQLIKLQAREGNQEGTGCVHGGSHPRVDLPASPYKFITLKIPWKNFRQDGLANGKLLNIQNLCKFNFVNYNPVSGATLEIKSILIKN